MRSTQPIHLVRIVHLQACQSPQRPEPRKALSCQATAVPRHKQPQPTHAAVQYKSLRIPSAGQPALATTQLHHPHW
jgi:hypothetical protein